MASSVDLGPYLEQFVSSLISSGRYNSKSEVLREGVRLIEDRERRLAALDHALDRGLAAGDAGQTVPARQVFAHLKAKYRKMAKSKA